MRRLPVYLLIDTSGSMAGEPIAAVQNGLQVLSAGVKSDPHALETAHISVITFSDQVNQVTPLTDAVSFQPPQLTSRGGTHLGAALQLLAKCLDKDLVKTTAEVKGDWKPMVFLFTDGEPTDEWKTGLAEIKNRKLAVFVACGAGPGVNVGVLKQITENVVLLENMGTSEITAFFKWLTASVGQGSQKLDAGGREVGGLSELPPPPPVINLVK